MPANASKQRSPGVPPAEDLRLDGQIGSDWWEEGVTGDWVRGELANRTGDLTVWLNSPGGDVIEGSLIYTALREYPGHVTICVDGIAASAASVIAMAADELCMSPTSYLMIHRASTIAWGNVDAMDEAQRELAAIDEGICEAYRLKTGMSRNKILQMMQDTTWLNAAAAVKMGFADRMLYRDGEEPEEQPEEPEEPEDGANRLPIAAAAGKPLIYASGVQHKWRSPDAGKLHPQFRPAPTPTPEPPPAAEPDAALIEQHKARLSLYATIANMHTN